MMNRRPMPTQNTDKPVARAAQAAPQPAPPQSPQRSLLADARLVDPMAPTKPKPTATTAWVWITPALAAQWLNDHNSGNRRMRPGQVDYLAGVLERDEYKFTHQGIAFAKSGRLLDGQHRLQAIIASGISTWLMVTEGLDDDAFEGMDAGAKRSIADHTQVDRATIEVCSYVAELVEGRLSKDCGRISPAQALKYHRLLGPTVAELNEFCGSTRRKVFTSATATAAAVIRILAFPEQRDHAFIGMAALRSQDYESMTPIQMALNRAVNDGMVNARDRHDTACRVWVALDPARAKLRKVQITDQGTALAQMRKAVVQLQPNP